MASFGVRNVLARYLPVAEKVVGIVRSEFSRAFVGTPLGIFVVGPLGVYLRALACVCVCDFVRAHGLMMQHTRTH